MAIRCLARALLHNLKRIYNGVTTHRGSDRLVYLTVVGKFKRLNRTIAHLELWHGDCDGFNLGTKVSTITRFTSFSLDMARTTAQHPRRFSLNDATASSISRVKRPRIF